MNRNIEWKARIRDIERQRRVAAELAGAQVQTLHQCDTFFPVPEGRLKLRQFEAGSGELIHYHREDRADAKASHYTLVPVEHPELLLKALSAALGVQGVVRKRREVYLVGQSRIQVDEVEGLGPFLEVEVVLRPDQSEDEGREIAEDLQKALGVWAVDLIDGAYVDLSRRVSNPVCELRSEP